MWTLTVLWGSQSESNWLSLLESLTSMHRTGTRVPGFWSSYPYDGMAYALGANEPGSYAPWWYFLASQLSVSALSKALSFLLVIAGPWLTVVFLGMGDAYQISVTTWPEAKYQLEPPVPLRENVASTFLGIVTISLTLLRTLWEEKDRVQEGREGRERSCLGNSLSLAVEHRIICYHIYHFQPN